LFAEEKAAIATALDTRREEFTRGRACARQALGRLGIPPQAIPVRSDRAPAWPRGIVGSITHTPGLVCAVAARSEVVAGLGVDIEVRNAPLRPTLDRFIRTPAERAQQAGLPPDLDPLRLVFSAKEAVHKCVAPLCGITLGFQDVELDVDVSDASFRVRLVGFAHPSLPDLRAITGKFAVTSRFVMTAAVMPAGKAQRASNMRGSTLRFQEE
jgi:4'-phosphopantetheinyl transferase EntD